MSVNKRTCLFSIIKCNLLKNVLAVLLPAPNDLFVPERYAVMVPGSSLSDILNLVMSAAIKRQLSDTSSTRLCSYCNGNPVCLLLRAEVRFCGVRCLIASTA